MSTKGDIFTSEFNSIVKIIIILFASFQAITNIR